jgi:hypothetical protein
LLEELAPGLFVHDGRKRFLGFLIHRCMTVIRLPSGVLWVHSPNALDKGLRAELDRLGRVGFVVAPNAMHGFAVDAFARAYPEARVLVAPNFPERHPGLGFTRVLGDAPEPAWAGELDQAIVAGNPFLHEVVFLHRATRTLVVTDLVENMRREHLSWWGRVLGRVFDFYGKPVPSPEHCLYTLDPDAAAASLERIRSWDFERIVLSHGARIECDAPGVFAQVAETLVERVRRRAPWKRRLFLWLSSWQ